jgi:peptidyl-prolyl cis-trans isomerase SurA
MRCGTFFCLSMLIWMTCLVSPSKSRAEMVDRILAVVNDEIIALSDLNNYQAFFGEEREPHVILEELIDQKLLFAEAQKFRLDEPSSEEVEAAYRKLEARLGGLEAMKETRKQLALSEQDLQVQIKARLMATQLIDQRVNFFIFVSPKEVEDYYQKHADEFSGRPPDQARSEIQDGLKQKRAELKRKDYLDRLKARATIEMN